MSQNQDILNIQVARDPIAPKPIRDYGDDNKVPSSVRAQDMDTSGYQVSNLDDVEFYGENDQLDVDAVFRPGSHTYTLFHFKICIFVSTFTKVFLPKTFFLLRPAKFFESNSVSIS